MLKISVAIMTHPLRGNSALELRQELAYPAQIVTDYESRGHSWNGLQAWKAYDKDADVHIVLEDDIILCPNFIENVRAVAAAHPRQLISFFHIKNRQVDLLQKGIHFCGMQRVSWNQAILLPSAMVTHLIEFVGDDKYKWTDDFLTAFCHALNIPLGLTIPNLVQHRLPRNSIVGNPPALGRKERISPVFINDISGFDINWNCSSTTII